MGLKTKLRGGRFMIDTEIEIADKRMYLFFEYNKELLEAVKETFEGRKWESELKCWSAPLTHRNLFRLEYLRGKYGEQPYQKYDDFEKTVAANIAKIKAYWAKRELPNLYEVQELLSAHGLSVQQFYWAAEMGIGKTLAAQVVMELSGCERFWWVGTKSTLEQTDIEFERWNSRVTPRFFTYDGLKKVVTDWTPGRPAPQFILFDEAHKIKTPTSQRSIAAKHVAEAMRNEYGEDAFIGGMSGTPMPRGPDDYWHQLEVVKPGFLAERDIRTFRNRVGLIRQQENTTGGVYPMLVTWLDDENKCAICGEVESYELHRNGYGNTADVAHRFKKSVNEVDRLSKRTRGLVIAKQCSDCNDLPDKTYHETVIEPSHQIKQLAKLITATSTRAIQALTLLRELSDGFQYEKTADGTEKCRLCHGHGTYEAPYDPLHEELEVEQHLYEMGKRRWYIDDEGEKSLQEPDDWSGLYEDEDIEYKFRPETCIRCFGAGEVDKISTTVMEVPCPKDDAFINILQLNDGVGRLAAYGGFTATLDRMVAVALKQDWHVIRVDGRGWRGFEPDGGRMPKDGLLRAFAMEKRKYPRVCLVGHPGSAGAGINLSASRWVWYYSNTFNGEDRMQSEARGTREGMDILKGGQIGDVIHLPSDRLVLNNVKKKKNLQNMSLHGLRRQLDADLA